MPVSRPEFRLRSLFLVTAVVAVECVVGPSIVRLISAIRRVSVSPWPR
jgi:hypothetical protein